MNHYYTKGSFTINWGIGKGASRHCRKRLMAILRMSSSVLGLSRKGLGLGMLGVGGRIALASIVISSAVVVGTQDAEAYAVAGGG